MKTSFIQGNEACARGAIDAGVRFFAGYPISPASELVEYCSQKLPELNGVFVQMEDEIGSIAAITGASLGGVKSLTATSGPGFSLMLENLGFAIMAEVPCVIVNVQRYGISTGVATKPGQSNIMQTRWGTHGDYSIIAMTPASVQECYDLTFEAFNLAERFSSPVIVLTDASIAHLREKVDIPDKKDLNIINRRKPDVPPEKYFPYSPDEKGVPALSAYGDEHILRVTGLVHDETGYSSSNPSVSSSLTERLERKIMDYQDELPKAKYFGQKNAEVLVISFGISARASREAVKTAVSEKLPVGMLQLQTMWPFPESTIQDFCKDASKVIMVEMNRGQVTQELKKILAPEKLSSVLRTDTEVVSPKEILESIKEALS